MLYSFLLGPVASVTSVATTLNYPEGLRSVSLEISTDDLNMVFLAMMFFAISWVIKEAHKLARESAEFVQIMAIVVNLDTMLAQHKVRSKELADYVGISKQNTSLLKTGRVRGVRFSTLDKICEYLQCQLGDILQYSP